MGVFRKSVEAGLTDLAACGYVHILGGADPEFVCWAATQFDDIRREEPLHGRGIGGKKWQAVLDLRPEYTDELIDLAARALGTSPSAVTMSQRHLMEYNLDLNKMPKPHKDRYASAISVGVTLDVAEGSAVVLYPSATRSSNPLLDTRYLEVLDPPELPEAALAEAEPMHMADRPGDVLIFRGNEIWHSRVNAAGARHAYFMFNALHLDPLGEDPREPLRRSRALQVAAAIKHGQRDASTIILGRRLDWVGCLRHRSGIDENVALVWPDRLLHLKEIERAVLDAIRDGAATYSSVAERLGPDVSAQTLGTAVSRMLEDQLLDVLT